MGYGRLTGYEVKGQIVELSFEEARARIETLTPRIVNVFCGSGAGRAGSKAIEGEKAVPVDIRTQRKEDGLWIHTGEVSVRVSDGFYVDFYDKEGAEVCADYRGQQIGRASCRERVLRLV